MTGMLPVEHPVGSILLYAGSSAPVGWLFCDASAVSRTTYANLFAVLSTTFGVGDGSTTFNLPDLKGRAPIGVGTGSGLTARARANKVGVETHPLSTAEMPAHTHTYLQVNVAGGGITNVGGTGLGVGTTGSTGGGGSHQNMQPSLALNFIIKI